MPWQRWCAFSTRSGSVCVVNVGAELARDADNSVCRLEPNHRSSRASSAPTANNQTLPEIGRIGPIVAKLADMRHGNSTYVPDATPQHLDNKQEIICRIFFKPDSIPLPVMSRRYLSIAPQCCADGLCSYSHTYANESQLEQPLRSASPVPDCAPAPETIASCTLTGNVCLLR